MRLMSMAAGGGGSSRSSKQKTTARLPTGFVMKRHQPSKPAYKILGADVTTEITFELPSTRFEIVARHAARQALDVVGLTVCTPIDAETTQVTQIHYWPAWLGFIKPFFMALGADLPRRRPPDGGTPEGRA